MKGSKFLFLLAAAVLIGGLALFMKSRDEAAWTDATVAEGAKLLGELPVNDVASVRLLGGEGRTTAKRVDGAWVVEERGNYPADFARVSALVRKLAELEPVQHKSLGAGDDAALDLNAPEGGAPDAGMGPLVELSDASGGKLASLVVGKTHSTTSPGAGPMGMAGGMVTGRYVMLADAPGTAYLVTETFTDLQTSPAQWIDKGFIRPGQPKLIAVQGQGKDRQWTIGREAPGAPWKLDGAAANQALDASKLSNIDSMVTGMTVADAPDSPDDARLKPLREKPVSVTIESFEGLRYALTFGEGGADNLPAEMIAVEVIGDPLPPPAPAPAEGQKSGEQAAKAMEDAKKARDEKLAQAARYQGKQVFIPRNFLQPFLADGESLLAAPAPSAAPPKKKSN